MIANDIPKTNQTLEERGIPRDSFFSIIFEDGSEVCEKNVNWSSFSERKEVIYLGIKKMVNVSRYPVKIIKCFHEGLESLIEVSEGCQVYQAIRGEAVIIPNYQRKDRIVGRIIGIIKDDEIIEEIFLNAVENKVEGFRK